MAALQHRPAAMTSGLTRRFISLLAVGAEIIKLIPGRISTEVGRAPVIRSPGGH